MSAFDSLAAAYDADFTERPIARWLRERTHDWLLTLFMPGAYVLELGSGTGEDAAFLIENGFTSVFNMKGGMILWNELGLVTEGRSED